MKQYRSGSYGVLLGLLALVGSSASAAVYNFYFNNTEQGDNSTATPSLSVTKTPDGKDEVKKEGGTEMASVPELPGVTPTDLPSPGPTPTPSPTPEAVADAAAPAAAQAVLEAPKPKGPSRFRLTLSGAGLTENQVRYEYEIPTYTYGWSTGWGGTLGLSFLPSRYLGFTLYGGLTEVEPYGGFDIDLYPLRLSLFGVQDFLEIGTSVGVSTIAGANYNFGSIHLGVRTNFNFGTDDFFLTAGLRGNYGYALADAGVGLRF